MRHLSSFFRLVFKPNVSGALIAPLRPATFPVPCGHMCPVAAQWVGTNRKGLLVTQGPGVKRQEPPCAPAPPTPSGLVPADLWTGAHENAPHSGRGHIAASRLWSGFSPCVQAPTSRARVCSDNRSRGQMTHVTTSVKKKLSNVGAGGRPHPPAQDTLGMTSFSFPAEQGEMEHIPFMQQGGLS